MGPQIKSNLWANLQGPPFNKISRTISISTIIDREEDRQQEALLNLFHPQKSII